MSRPQRLNVSTIPEDHDKAFPSLRQPTIVGEFTLDSERQFLQDRSGLGYLVRPPDPDRVKFDLNLGMGQVVRKLEGAQGGAEGLTRLLQGILAHRRRFAVQGDLSSLHTDLVCFRGLLTTLLCSPYEAREAWALTAVRWRGTLYLRQQETPARRRDRERETDRQRTMSSWGYKFEQHLTAADPGSRPDIRQPVNENEEFCCMFRSRVGGLSLVYGAEMDAYTGGAVVPPGDPLSPDRFVEMKTSREVETDKQARTFRRFKTLKWWAQSFLVGTPEVLCGWRDDDGVVWRLETFKVKDLPKAGEEWRPNICFNFLTALLQELQARLAGDGLDTVWEVTFEPRRGVEVSERRLERGEEHPVLPAWYTDQLFRES